MSAKTYSRSFTTSKNAAPEDGRTPLTCCAKALGRWRDLSFPLSAAILITTGCNRSITSPPREASEPAPRAAAVSDTVAPDPCELALIPQAGDHKLDEEIRRMQEHARTGPDRERWIERLGWAFVAKARESFDPGYYKLAEQCALCLESHKPRCAEGLLLRGHVLHNLHQFKEAEPLARQLVSQRGLSFDYALLGDVLMEQGHLNEAAAAYQEMVNQRPDLESYARISHLRWLKGDLDGALEVMKLAVSAASPKAPEPAAWVNTRLAFLEFQDGNLSGARQSCQVALDYQPEHAPALLLQGRLLLADGNTSEAVEVLQRAVQINPLPEYQWALSEALRSVGRDQEAQELETQLNRDGAATDPRTYALFLATKGANPTTALDLARQELTARGDVFTHDALAWSLASNGQFGEAHKEIKKALAEGTRDGRLFFHAAVIAAKAGDKDEAQLWFERAAPLLGLLLPSEQSQLLHVAVEVGDVDAGRSEDTLSSIFAPGS